MMIWTDRAILLLALVLFHSLFSLTSSSSCPFSNAVDHEHQDAIAVNDHDHAHYHDHSDHDHDHGHSHAHDHGHSHAHGDGCIHDYHVGHTDSHHDHGHHHHHHHDHAPADNVGISKHMLAEELAEEEELRLYGFMSSLHMEEAHHHKQGQRGVPTVGLWMRALGCSLLVSMASLICLIILPLIVSHGKPSRTVVDFLAAFGAGAMLGDAFLHQLPHALGGSHTHPHSHGPEHKHEHLHGHHEGMGHSHDGDHGHAHSIEDLSVGLAVLAGIILFFIVEKIVRQVERSSSKAALPWAHHHHHHHGRHNEDESLEQHLNGVDEKKDGEKSLADDTRIEDTSETSANGSFKRESSSTVNPYRRKKTADIQEESEALKSLPEKEDSDKKSSVVVAEQAMAPNLILGYLNLFSDGVHNFTDGMALGAAFLNHGTLGGWSRTLFLLAHELPQEVGDFGILVQSGFSVVKALAFNFLSALVALAGTAVALVLGGNPGHSSLIEGFTAGGFIYIAVAGVLPEMHQHGTSPKTTIIQLIALSLGMSVALTISLVE